MAFCASNSEIVTEVEAFAEAAAQRAASTLARSGIHRETLSIGELRFDLVEPASRPERRLGRAFFNWGAQHSEHTPPSSHRLTVWEGTSQDAIPPKLPWSHTYDGPSLGVVGSYAEQAIQCALDAETNSIVTCDVAKDSSHTWFPSISQLPAIATTSPFRIALSWHCNRNGMQFVHGAAVAIGDRAVLLAGAAGSGKSTTALACALVGFGYLADDYCAVEPAAGKIHMIYRTAKVSRPTLAMLPALESWITNRNQIGRDKGVMFLEPSNIKLVRSADLSAILLPRVGTERATKISPAARIEVVRAILPSTIMQLMGGTPATPDLILKLAQSVPAFHLSLGTDIAGLTETVAKQLLKPT